MLLVLDLYKPRLHTYVLDIKFMLTETYQLSSWLLIVFMWGVSIYLAIQTKVEESSKKLNLLCLKKKKIE